MKNCQKNPVISSPFLKHRREGKEKQAIAKLFTLNVFKCSAEPNYEFDVAVELIVVKTAIFIELIYAVFYNS